MLLLIHGSDTYRIKAAQTAVTARHRDEHGCGPLFFDLSTLNELECFQQAIGTASFFGERRLLIAHNPLECETIADRLAACNAAAIPDADLVLVQPTAPKIPAGVARALKRLETLATNIEVCGPLAGEAALQWVRQFCGKRDRTITATAVQELLRRTEHTSWATAQELEKLCAYVHTEITLADVQTIVSRPPSIDQWELSNALADQQKRKTLTALWRKVHEGTAEPLLIGAVAASMRTLLMIRDLTDRNTTASVIAKITGLHPFVISKTLRGARAYTPNSLKTAHTALAALDRQTKMGRADAVDGLFSILLNL
jgi:DNA polymerase III delta subunit